VLGWQLGRAADLLRRRGATVGARANLIPGPVRLLVLVVAIRWSLSMVDLPLVERQFWTATATILATIAVGWLLLLANVAGELYVRRRLQGLRAAEMASLLRIARRIVDLLVIVAAGLVLLRYFGFDPTAALAGLGIGGIAVALAAQKTLENVIGGLSITFDRAVQVGDFLKLGDMRGTVEHIGLRSTRIRTLDRTVLSVPNGQIANVNIETLSARDKFWFHHVVNLGYTTTSAQMRSIVEGIGQLLAREPAVDPEVIRVRFFRLAAYSLDVEISAYILASNWEDFLGVQQELLFQVMEIVERAGASIVFPSQTLYLADGRSLAPVEAPAAPTPPDRAGEARQATGTA
jgi:MscS family membrane protein